jgi:DNA-binding response OmpR family regulator/DNA polymerase III delta prime subunit
VNRDTIVVADNSHTIRRIIELTFSDEVDIELITFENGFNLREKLLELKPKIILVDIKLPEFDGYKVCKFINETESLKNTKVFLLKGGFVDVDENRLKGLRYEDIITKPFDTNPLLLRIKEILKIKEEQEARRYIIENDYRKGREWLLKAVKANPARKQRVIEEFGFIYNFDKTLEEDEKNWEKEKDQIQWRKSIWEYLSAGNLHGHQTNTENEKERNAGKELDESKSSQPKDITVISEIVYDEKEKMPEQKGKELEKDMLKLFKHFLRLCEESGEITIVQVRDQRSSDQSGYDLKFVFKKKGNQKLNILVECKNYKEDVTLKSIADKLDEVKAYHPEIDHWILLSPRANVANKVDRLLEAWEKTGEYPFGVQLWTKEFMVEDFFGLYPEIYDKYFSPAKDQLHPKDWDEKKKKEVIKTWRQKLEPPLQLPGKWKEYLVKPHKLFLGGDPKNIEDLYEHGVTMMCKDETGQLLKEPLENKVREWLKKPVDKEPSLILLGEFGDGKTVFTYVLARKLFEEFRQSPVTGWIPIRFALKDFGSKDVNSSSRFVEKRIKEFGIDLDGWNDLKYSNYKILAILDGFDEISKKLDPKTVLENIDYLIDCFENEFPGMKLLITSRKHFFENQQNKRKLIKRIGNPQLLQMAPIDRRTTLSHLEEYAKQKNLEGKLNKLKNCHDPIGLASKPLFLEMVKSSLNKLPENEFSEHILYETYIQNALERKFDYLDHEEKDTDPEIIIANMTKILGEVALALHESQEEFVYLSEVKGASELKQHLWNMSFEDDVTSEDEKARVAVRSLLKRVEPNKEPGENQKWPVDFCHRSMREFFVARAVCNLIENNPTECEKYLKNHFLSYEIIFFAGEIMKTSDFDYTEELKKLINRTKNRTGTEKLKVGHLGCNGANLLYQYKEYLPGDDWTKLVLDGANLPDADMSGKDFSGTSLQYANLDNANFTNAIFLNCNLTGVRLEETSPVHSIAVSASENIYASYDDGNIREWFFQPRRRPYSKTLSVDQKVKDVRLFPFPGDNITAMHGQYLYFYDKDEDRLQKLASIEIKPNLKLVKATQTHLLLIEEKGGRHLLQLVNLGKQNVIKWVEVPPFSICENLDEKALVTYDDDNGLIVIVMVLGKPQKFKMKGPEHVTCLASIRCQGSTPQYRLAVGQQNGIVEVYTINLTDRKVQVHRSDKKHEKAVKDIAFIDSTRILSGGFDRKIMLHKIDKGSKLKFIDKLEMSMQCRGMKTDGIIRDEERQILEGFKTKLAEIES